MKRKLITLCSIFCVFALFAQDLPKDPKPGKCYVKCVTKDEFKTVEETFLLYPEYSKLEAVPAVYKDETERVLVKEESKKLIYVPAVYETVEVPYIKKEKGNILSIVPATFGNDSKVVEIFPLTSGWVYNRLENCPSVNKQECLTACFMEYPAKHQTVNFTTLVKDASTTEKEIVEVKSTYKKQVVKTPARMDEVVIPAEYATITKQVLVSPATTKKVVVPAEYQKVSKQVLTKKGGETIWEEVDCELLNPTLLPITYDLNSARITEESKRIIDNMLLPLLKGKSTQVEIMAHTDSRGSDDYNKSLSQQRANSVVNYLVSKGISRSRMVANGYGATQLINKCAKGVECSDAEHRQNRRTEFRILQ